MNAGTRIVTLQGPVGPIDCAVDQPPQPRAIALIAHPHPLFGGTRDNKVVQTIARALLQKGAICWRPNFRGVGGSAGQFDEGRGESDDLLAVLDQALAEGASLGLAAPVPLYLAGFSFGSFVQSLVAGRVDPRRVGLEPMVLVGTAASRFDVIRVPDDTLVVHGETDDVVPLASVFDWARPQGLPVVVIPGTGHFFHGQLNRLKSLILIHLGGRDA